MLPRPEMLLFGTYTRAEMLSSGIYPSHMMVPDQEHVGTRARSAVENSHALQQPLLLDLLQRFPLRLRHPAPDHGDQHNTHGPVEPESKSMMERRDKERALIEHGEGLGDDVVGQPQEQCGDGHGSSPNLCREDLREQHPGDRPYSDGKAGNVG